MLARRRSIILPNGQSFRTPRLVPSFSSKGFPEVRNMLRYGQEIITDTMLISAYDISYENIDGPFNAPELLIIDSGGYEANVEYELSECKYAVHTPKEWSVHQYKKSLESVDGNTLSLLVSYDHPKERCSINNQINNAYNFFSEYKEFGSVVLLKPENENDEYLPIDTIISNLKSLSSFSVIGLTEKELGKSVFERMKNIAKIRTELNMAGLDTPIHIFGSLDTICTPLYFLSGADIFDGLTWLRLAYYNGYTMYNANVSSLELGIDGNDSLVHPFVMQKNLSYLRKLERDMCIFCNNGEFKSFEFHGDFFQKCFLHLMAELEGKYHER